MFTDDSYIYLAEQAVKLLNSNWAFFYAHKKIGDCLFA
nr:MAG TPA: hypothetical protein [Caudoviricetes sp.]